MKPFWKSIKSSSNLINHEMSEETMTIKTIFAIKGMLEDVLLPTINYIPDPEMELDCVAEGKRNLLQEYVLKNAFGFGGCNACLIFHRAK